MNTWPGGKRHAMTQSEHEKWNAYNYPGTLQICCICDNPTTFCEEDGIFDENEEPYCRDCAVKQGIIDDTENQQGGIMRGEKIKACFAHDAGAFARCSYCGRYSDNYKSLYTMVFLCECGKKDGWSGSFEKPTEDSMWSDK